MNPDECPVCDTGVLATWQVAATNETIRVCDECDGVWEATDELPGPPLTTIEQFLLLRGRPPLWSELHRLDEAPAAHSPVAAPAWPTSLRTSATA